MTTPQHHITTLREILSLPTAPFLEQAVQDWLLRWADELGLKTREDRHGNLLIGLRRGRLSRGHRPWVLAAHMDHPGFRSTRQLGRTVWGQFFGGVPVDYFAGAAMKWHAPGGTVDAVVQSAMRQTAPYPHVAVRTRLADAASVPAGSLGIWALPPFRLQGKKVAGRACDDLGGVALAVCALEGWVRSGKPGEMYLLASRAEEAGLIGAVGAIRSGLIPAQCVILSLETSSAAAGHVEQGAGVVIRVGDRASVFDPVVTQTLCELAGDLCRRDKRFRWQRALMPGGTCEASAYAAFGHTAGAICLPLGNYHNCGPENRIAPETINLDDFSTGVQLLTALPNRAVQTSWQTLRKHFDSRWRAFRRLLTD